MRATGEGQAADRTSHEAILYASRNDALIAPSSGSSACVGWTARFEQRTRALPRDPLPDHRRVHDAIAAGDPDAAAAVPVPVPVPVRLALDDTWFGIGGVTVR